jgi:hypothetical protein
MRREMEKEDRRRAGWIGANPSSSDLFSASHPFPLRVLRVNPFRTRTNEKERAGFAGKPARPSSPEEDRGDYGLVVTMVYEPLPLYEYTRQR